jgi:hypothetical protein
MASLCPHWHGGVPIAMNHLPAGKRLGNSLRPVRQIGIDTRSFAIFLSVWLDRRNHDEEALELPTCLRQRYVSSSLLGRVNDGWRRADHSAGFVSLDCASLSFGERFDVVNPDPDWPVELLPVDSVNEQRPSPNLACFGAHSFDCKVRPEWMTESSFRDVACMRRNQARTESCEYGHCSSSRHDMVSKTAFIHPQSTRFGSSHRSRFDHLQTSQARCFATLQRGRVFL